MPINNRNEALGVLGLPLSATKEQIKNAYKNLVKLYHPDGGNIGDTQSYQEIVEAYEFLCNSGSTASVRGQESFSTTPARGQETFMTSGPKILGSETRYHDDAASWEKKVKKHNEKKAQAFQENVKAYSEKLEKQEEDFKRAMEAINAIRTAEALKAWIAAHPNPDNKWNQ